MVRLAPMGANISGDGLSSPSSPGLSRGPIAVQAETMVPGTSPGMTPIFQEPKPIQPKVSRPNAIQLYPGQPGMT